MEHYTRTTIMQSGIKIRRERALPQSGEVSVGVGNEVTPIQVVARMPLETHFAIVDGSEALGVPPEEVKGLVIVEDEAIVEVGTVLAKKEQFARKRQVLAPVEGKLFDVVNGRIVISQTAEWLEKQAMVSGRVVSYMGDRGVIIETHGTLIQGVWGSGKENFGKLKVATRNFNGSLTKDQVSGDVGTLVLAAGRVEHLEVLEIAEQRHVAGIIAGSMSAELCMAASALSYPIILTDGVGKQNMTPAIFSLLQGMDGRETSLFADYDRSRGQRPEIIIPEPPAAAAEAVAANRPIRLGQMVRLLRAPYIGYTGEIVKIYALSQILATSAKAQGVDVRLADGSVVFVPFANFDVMV
jgi:hypothetical protein